MEPHFQVGDLVCLCADHDRQGSVIEILPAVRGTPRYRVFHSTDFVREYDEDQLTAVAHRPLGLSAAVGRRQWLDADEFKARLAAVRLAHPLVDNVYALHAARIQYIPFQFKPLLRFLRADQPRVLIADEVGVGKTIEAGLILKELQAREQVDNVLIVCPKALVHKWRVEMRRFDENFHPMTSETLRYCLRETEYDGVWPREYSRAIVHLELLRLDPYLSGVDEPRRRPGLVTLQPPPHFSVVIVDEAHHLRNPETNSWELARFLCDTSETVLFLTATPIHLGSRNLFVLLNLLRPDLFPDENVFNEIIEPNPHLNEAIRRVRTRQPEDTWQQDAMSGLRRAATTSWGRRVLGRDPRFADWYEKLSEQPLPEIERIRCLRDLEELHSLAHVMNRTRRRDIGKFTIREPHTVTCPFTPQQQEFYEELIDFRRQTLMMRYDPIVVRLITDTLERQASSCLPALVPLLHGFLHTGKFTAAHVSDDVDVGPESFDLPSSLGEQARRLYDLAHALSAEDPKFDQLLEIAQSTLRGDGPGKVLVFSYFLHTLSYLARRLREHGMRVGLVTGQVPDEEREMLRTRFRAPRGNNDSLDVLLSSEVGCEGLDYEFCDRLVNYDIPWNPMRIEQRIGRIDRFGQNSKKILIYNFITPGTVEERIFFRCFERLGVFRETIGDLEEVLGGILDSLNEAALDPCLTPEQAQEKAEQAADNTVRLIEERRRMEEESRSLFGLDEAFTQELEDLSHEGRFVSPDELQHMISMFLAQPDIGGILSAVADMPGRRRLRLNRDGRTWLHARVRALEATDRSTVEFSRWLQGDQPNLVVTFDQTTALEQRDLTFITPVHALARAAVRYWEEQTEPLVSRLEVADHTVTSGTHVFVCDLWETVGLQAEVRLVGFARDLHDGSAAPDLSAKLVSLLSRADSPGAGREFTGTQIRQVADSLSADAFDARQQALDELRKRSNRLADIKLASIEGHYNRRRERVQAELADASDENIRRMKESELSRIEHDYANKCSEVEKRRNADIVVQRVAAGVLVVKGEANNAN